MKNRLCHFEIVTRNINRAIKFYTTIFDWKIKWDKKTDYGIIDTGAYPEGGLFKARKDEPLGVSLYFLVESIEETLENIEKNGGKMIVPKTEIPDIGWFAFFSDLDDNVVGIYENLK